MIPEAWLQDQEDGEVVWWPPTRKPDDAQMHIAKCTKPGPDWHCFPVVEICPRRVTKDYRTTLAELKNFAISFQMLIKFFKGATGNINITNNINNNVVATRM